MSAKQVPVWDLWFNSTLSGIEKATLGVPDTEERQSRIDELAETLQSKPPGVQEAISAAVETAAQEDMITEKEAQRLPMRD